MYYICINLNTSYWKIIQAISRVNSKYYALNLLVRFIVCITLFHMTDFEYFTRNYSILETDERKIGEVFEIMINHLLCLPSRPVHTMIERAVYIHGRIDLCTVHHLVSNSVIISLQMMYSTISKLFKRIQKQVCLD